METTADDRVTSAELHNEDQSLLIQSLRPATLDEFIGQDHLKAGLSMSLQSARKQNKTLDHVLFYGSPGLGKTTLACIIASEMGGNLVQTIGPSLERTADLVGLLASLQTGDILFIDEAHRLPRELEEILYPAMEDFRVDFLMGSGSEARAFPMPIQPFTLIGATTRKGMLSKPLLDRFGLDFELTFYDVSSLALIVKRSALLLHLRIDDEAAVEIGKRSRGTPRVTNRLLRRVHDYVVVHDVNQITKLEVLRAMDIIAVDEHGMDNLDRRYLSTLLGSYGGGPAGVGALAASISEEVSTLTDVVEPYLLHQQEYIARTSNGRRLTDKGREIATRIRLKGI